MTLESINDKAETARTEAASRIDRLGEIGARRSALADEKSDLEILKTQTEEAVVTKAKELYDAALAQAREAKLAVKKYPKPPTETQLVMLKKQAVKEAGIDVKIVNNASEQRDLAREAELQQYRITLAIASIEYFSSLVRGFGRG